MTAPIRPEVVPAWSNERGEGWTVLYSTTSEPTRIQLHPVLETEEQAHRWRDWLEARQARMLRRAAS